MCIYKEIEREKRKKKDRKRETEREIGGGRGREREGYKSFLPLGCRITSGKVYMLQLIIVNPGNKPTKVNWTLSWSCPWKCVEKLPHSLVRMERAIESFRKGMQATCFKKKC